MLIDFKTIKLSVLNFNVYVFGVWLFFFWFTFGYCFVLYKESVLKMSNYIFGVVILLLGMLCKHQISFMCIFIYKISALFSFWYIHFILSPLFFTEKQLICFYIYCFFNNNLFSSTIFKYASSKCESLCTIQIIFYINCFKLIFI